MTLAQVYEALRAELTGTPPDQSIDLYAASRRQDALAPLQGVLALFAIASSYEVSAASLAQPPGSVVLAGVATFGAPGAAPASPVLPRRAAI